MNRHKWISIIVAVVFLSFSANAVGEDLSEPDAPGVDKVFDPEKEKKIDETSTLPAEDVFAQLKTDEFISNPDMTYKTIYKTFHNRRPEILDIARMHMLRPVTDVVNEEGISHARDFDVSKRIFETFPEDSTPVLVSMYREGDAVTRGNVIRAAGKVAGGPTVKRLLIAALDDVAFFEVMAPDDMGESLRVCDMAYNQLVLRYGIRNMHRTIGPGNSVEVRDELISMLKTALNTSGQGKSHE